MITLIKITCDLSASVSFPVLYKWSRLFLSTCFVICTCHTQIAALGMCLYWVTKFNEKLFVLYLTGHLANFIHSALYKYLANRDRKSDIEKNNVNNLSLGYTLLSVINLTFPCKVTLVNVSGPKFYLVLITHFSESMWNNFIGLSPNSALLVLIWFLQNSYESHIENID